MTPDPVLAQIRHLAAQPDLAPETLTLLHLAAEAQQRGKMPAMPHTNGLALLGLRWKAVINGRRCINGSRYSATITGKIEASQEWNTIYDVIHELAEHLEANNREMELPDSFQITLYPPNT